MAEPSFTREQLQSIEAPALIIIGDSDFVTPEHAVERFRTIPAAQLCAVPHPGHDVMPKETILTFFQEGATGESRWEGEDCEPRKEAHDACSGPAA